jgi:hypothetical protein
MLHSNGVPVLSSTMCGLSLRIRLSRLRRRLADGLSLTANHRMRLAILSRWRPRCLQRSPVNRVQTCASLSWRGTFTVRFACSRPPLAALASSKLCCVCLSQGMLRPMVSGADLKADDEIAEVRARLLTIEAEQMALRTRLEELEHPPSLFEGVTNSVSNIPASPAVTSASSSAEKALSRSPSIKMGRARSVVGSGIFRLLRRRSAMCPSPHPEARGAFELR